MKVILLENIDNVGKKGETREVKEGFGRNFLIPRRLAIPATRGNIKNLQEHARKLIDLKEREVKSAEATKKRLDEAVLTIKHKAGQDGKLFGSVTVKELAEAIKKAADIEVDRKSIKLDEPIKMTGAYSVEVQLEKGITAQVKVEVEQE